MAGARQSRRRERAQRVALTLAAAAMGLTGLRMLIAPQDWFAATPGVPETGPFNPHLVQDVGAAFLALGAGLVFAIPPLPARFALVLVAALFALLHALLHLVDALAPEGRPVGRAEAAAILIPAVLAVAMAVWTWPRRQA